VPLHLTAFHPAYKLLDRPPTPPATLTRARGIALDNGIHYAYTGNVDDPEGDSTWCHSCGRLVIERDGYRLGAWNLTVDGRCHACETPIPGVFRSQGGSWSGPRLRVTLARGTQAHR
jgi:pyruvate formate lyase activating enzyme